MLLEATEPSEPLQGGSPHLRGIRKTHMVFNERKDLFCVFIRKAQAPANLLGHFHTDSDVTVEANTVAGFGGRFERRWLADVVKKNAPGQGRRRSRGELFDHHPRV